MGRYEGGDIAGKKVSGLCNFFRNDRYLHNPHESIKKAFFSYLYLSLTN